ncbi:hypothetical protein [Salinarimonas rosea]|uniref:hypothetical protein n=1 Tax=Salinarimonas rosea TaxID=552063 RepID=UPI0004131A92|nr:hypothetical protein [Salinarimonas rosea]
MPPRPAGEEATRELENAVAEAAPAPAERTLEDLDRSASILRQRGASVIAACTALHRGDDLREADLVGLESHERMWVAQLTPEEREAILYRTKTYDLANHMSGRRLIPGVLPCTRAHVVDRARALIDMRIAERERERSTDLDDEGPALRAG